MNWMMPTAWLDAYFERVQYSGSTDVSLETLRELHMAHVFNVPFENLNIHIGRSIDLNPEALVAKIVQQHRGGYCFEMNGLFALVLEALGFTLDRLLARVLLGRDPSQPNPRTHQLLLVHLGDQRWMVDVGFGGHGLITPLPFWVGYTERQFTEHFGLRQDERLGYVLQGETHGEWLNQYSFSLDPQLPIDYVAPNYYTSTWPTSSFVQRRVSALPKRSGRLAMTNATLKIIENDATTEIHAENHEQYLAILRDYFGIRLTADEISYPS
jgi:N-hydroxyarylamine O-acetyltransferase